MNPRAGIVVYDASPFQAVLTPERDGWRITVARAFPDGGWIGRDFGVRRSFRRAARAAIREAVETHAAYNQETF